MSRRCWCLALALGLAAAGAWPAAAQPLAWPGKSYALLIATNQYDYWNDLANPIDDAEAIQEELEEVYGFEVETLWDPTLADLKRKLREYGDREFGDLDQLLVFFAGHGALDRQTETGYLVARDTRLEGDDPLYDSYLPYSDVLPLIDRFDARHVLVLVDACFSGSAVLYQDRGVAEPEPGALRHYVSDKLSHRARRILTSGGLQPVDDGAAEQHSPFAQGLIQVLRGHGGELGAVTLGSLAARLQLTAPKHVAGRFASDELATDFFLIPSAEWRREREAPAPAVSAAAAPEAILPSRAEIDLRAEPAKLTDSHLARRFQQVGLRDSQWNPSGGLSHVYDERSYGLDDVVADGSTGLMWQRAGTGHRLTWEEARAWVAQVNARGYAGHRDWRLPTVEELASLIEPEPTATGLHLAPAFDPEQVECWSADLNAESGEPWYVRFQSGQVRSFSRDPKFFVRLVRRF